MAKKIETIWPIEPHTEAKHAILKKYLDAWLPIMARWNGHVNYIDGFAGPGEYRGGEEGSPLIAIKAITEHRANLQSDFGLLFIEDDRARCEFLEHKISQLSLPKNVSAGCFCGRFDATITSVLDDFEKDGRRLAPTFVFIDPFGFSGVPLNLIKRIMTSPRCEVLITFMYEELNRFINEKPLWNCLSALFGNEEWKTVVDIRDPQSREMALQNIYKSQLESAGNIQYVISFKMINKLNKTDYFLFFGTNNILGLKKMKEAMWKVDETGSFEFSDATHNPSQPMLLQHEPDYLLLKRLILDNFKGRSISLEDLETYVLTRTPFRETHYKRQVLIPMENAGEIRIHSPNRRRRLRTYPSGSLLEFL